MVEVLIMGEMLVEIMRPEVDTELYEPGIFKGPYPSGAPAIFIDTVARLGHNTAIIGGVGNDDFGKNILDRLKKDGVNCEHVLVSEDRTTGVAFVTYFADGSRKFIYHMDRTAAVEPKMPDVSKFGNVKYFHVMGCSLMANAEFAEEIVKTMRALVQQGAKVSFDPNIRTELQYDQRIQSLIREVLDNTNVLLPGVDELLFLTGAETVEAAVAKCFENPALEIIALKRGAKGSTIFTRDEILDVGAFTVEQLDPTGAGDCFDGAFIAGLIEGKDPKDAALMGAAAGALNAAAFGPMEGNISQQSIAKMIEENR